MQRKQTWKALGALGASIASSQAEGVLIDVPEADTELWMVIDSTSPSESVDSVLFDFFPSEPGFNALGLEASLVGDLISQSSLESSFLGGSGVFSALVDPFTFQSALFDENDQVMLTGLDTFFDTFYQRLDALTPGVKKYVVVELSNNLSQTLYGFFSITFDRSEFAGDLIQARFTLADFTYDDDPGITTLMITPFTTPGGTPGDTDNDGDIDDADLAVSFSNYTGPAGTGKSASEGDTDGDGDVDDADLAVSFSGYTGPTGPGASVPEPVTLAALAGGMLLAGGRRRSCS